MTKTQKKNKEAEWFGYTKTDAEQKKKLVGDVFANVADKYDLMNDLMSGGIHRIWKNRLIGMMQPRASRKLLDVAGGTGDIAFRYRAKAGPDADITVCDINPAMLRVGQDRAVDRGYLSGINWVEGNAEELPFEDNSFHVYSISFGLRNVPRIDNALEDAYRVLMPGGRFFCMEFSRVNNDKLRWLYDRYSFAVIPKIGQLVASDRDSYQYLVESIRQFPPQDELKSRMETAGFEDVRVINLSGGIAAIHIGYKY